jgi:NifB/MoaA-like Fe-S oxidoreductase
VDADHKARTDELVQLDVVDMATRSQLRSVLDDEDVVRVGAELGHGVALDAGPDGQGVEAEHL